MAGFTDFLEKHIIIPETSTLQPKGEDMFENNLVTPYVNMAKLEGVVLTVIKLAGAAGTATVTCKTADNAAGDNAANHACKYRKATTPDTFTSWAASVASGTTISAGADEVWQFALSNLDMAGSDDQWVGFTMTEVDSTAVDGTAFLICIPKEAQAIQPTILS